MSEGKLFLGEGFGMVDILRFVCCFAVLWAVGFAVCQELRLVMRQRRGQYVFRKQHAIILPVAQSRDLAAAVSG